MARLMRKALSSHSGCVDDLRPVSCTERPGRDARAGRAASPAPEARRLRRRAAALHWGTGSQAQPAGAMPGETNPTPLPAGSNTVANNLSGQGGAGGQSVQAEPTCYGRSAASREYGLQEPAAGSQPQNRIRQR